MSIYPPPEFNQEFNSADFPQVADDEVDLSNYLNKLESSTIVGNLQLNSRLFLDNGTVSVPSLTYINDTNTGFYRIGDDNIGISTAGSNRVDISNDRVYVSNKLNINDGSVGSPTIYFGGDDNTGFYRAGSNNIGITTGGNNRVDVNDSRVLISNKLYINDGSAASPTLAFNGDDNTGIFSESDNQINITTAGVSRFDINTARVHTELPLYISNGTSSNPALVFNDDTDTGFYRNGANNIGISTGGSNRLDISNDKVNISNKLTLPAGSVGSPSLSFNDEDTGIYSVGNNNISISTGGSNRLNISNDKVNISNKLNLPAGSVGLPSLSFNDEDTGIYSVGNNNLSISTGGVNRMSISDTRCYIPNKLYIDNGAVDSPSLVFATDINTGIYRIGVDNIGISTAGVNRVDISNDRVYIPGGLHVSDGSVGSPGVAFGFDSNTGIYRIGSNNLGISTGGNLRFNVEDSKCVSSNPIEATSTGSGASTFKNFQNSTGNVLNNFIKLNTIFTNTFTSTAWALALNAGNDLSFQYASRSELDNFIERGYMSDTASVSAIDFTGQHRSLSDLTDIKIGYIVCSTGSMSGGIISINESIPVVEYSNNVKDVRVFGVISDEEDEKSDTREYASGVFVSVVDKANDDNRLIINSVGEGAIWVCNNNGNLLNGDYITTSNIEGLGQKQDDDIMHSYTVAKITMDCDFTGNNGQYEVVDEGTYIRAFVGCTYHCG